MDESRLNIFKSIDLTENIIEVLPFLSYITDEDGKIVYMNKKAKEVFKKERYEYIKNAYEFFDMYHMFSEEGEKLGFSKFPLYRSLKNKEEVKNETIKVINKNNAKEHYICASSYPLIKDSKILGALITLRDTTEEYLYKIKIKSEREKFLELSTELKTKCDIIEILRNREKEHLMHLKDVINNISEGIIVFDTHGKLSLCNKAIFNMLNVKVGDLVNKKFMDKFTLKFLGEDRIATEEEFYLHLSKKKPLKNKFFKLIYKENSEKNYKYIEVNSAPIISKKDELIYTIITIKDVTETKLHQINAEEQAAFVKDVVNTVDVPIAVVDYPSLKYRLTNKKYEEITKLRDFINIKGEEVFKYKNNDLYEIIKSVGEKETPYTITPYKVEDLKGDDRFYKIKFIPYKNKDNTVRIHIYGSDITEERNHNIELEKVTKLKDEFFTITSHELRTPLTIIYSSLQLAYDVYGQDITPNMDKTLSRINQNCSRLLKLINNILDISKAEAGFLSVNSMDFDIVYVSESIVNSSNSYAVSKGIELIFDTNEEECNVRLDKDKYEKVLLNLLSNAVKFTPEGKQIVVSLKIEEDFFYLKVRDYGVGIPEDKVNFIFDRFSQINSSLSRRAEGTGIGLALVKKIVELMNGEIIVRSKLGEGTEFIVKFKRICAETNHIRNYAILTENINDRIHIEFSDIN